MGLLLQPCRVAGTHALAITPLCIALLSHLFTLICRDGKTKQQYQKLGTNEVIQL